MLLLKRSWVPSSRPILVDMKNFVTKTPNVSFVASPKEVFGGQNFHLKWSNASFVKQMLYLRLKNGICFDYLCVGHSIIYSVLKGNGSESVSQDCDVRKVAGSNRGNVDNILSPPTTS